MSKKKNKKHKKLKEGGALALASAVLSQLLGQILGDALEIAVERVQDAGDKARKAIKKKARHTADGVHAVAS